MKKILNTLLGILVLGVIIGGCFGTIKLATYAIGYLQEGTRPPPGDAAKFDPITSYADVAKFAGDNVQVEYISMEFVKSDGTMDLTADYGAEASYRFAHILDKAPDNGAPLGAGGKPGGTYAELINVNVDKPRLEGTTSGTTHYDWYNFGMSRTVIPAQPLTEPTAAPPTCSTKQLWDAAIKNDAPANAVATIYYSSDGYAFDIKDTSVHLLFDTSCNLIK